MKNLTFVALIICFLLSYSCIGSYNYRKQKLKNSSEKWNVVITLSNTFDSLDVVSVYEGDSLLFKHSSLGRNRGQGYRPIDYSFAYKTQKSSATYVVILNQLISDSCNVVLNPKKLNHIGVYKIDTERIEIKLK